MPRNRQAGLEALCFGVPMNGGASDRVIIVTDRDDLDKQIKAPSNPATWNRCEQRLLSFGPLTRQS